MLNLWGPKHRFCDGISRRDFFKVGSLGMGLTIADLLRFRAAGAVQPQSRPKSVIMVYLWGGLSHIDTYDMKPGAPVDYRGEFKPIQTKVPGLDLCELLPLHARVADQFSVVRGVRAYSPEHNSFEMATGAAETWQPRRPAIGSVVSRMRGDSPMPHFVNLAVTAGNVTVNHDPTYLGAAHKAFQPGGQTIANLTLRGGAAERLNDRKALLQSLDSVQRERDGRGEMSALDAHQAKAMDMILSGQVRSAFDVSRETDKVREQYALAPQLLLARRLVESGVSLVTTLLAPKGILNNGSWDTHSDNFSILRRGLPLLM